MKLGRYFPRETPMDIFFDLLVYVMNCMLEKEHGSVHGLGVVANMTGWKMENFSVPYWHKFLMILQGYRVPTRISLFLIVNPPFWFGSIWKIMKTMMSEDFQKKVAVIGFDELDRYLMDGCFHHLPDDVEGGTLNTDMLVKAFIAERKAIESKPLYGQEQTISMSNSSIHLN
jgi:CRAL/TRIO domain